jgi:hypothetical protein
MIILQESGSSQTINFIPREYTSGTTYTVKIVNESTNAEVYNEDVTSFTENLYYYQYSDTFSLKEDTFYLLTITSSEIVFKDKIFCTNQTVTDYSVNEAEYTPHTTENEFIFL